MFLSVHASIVPFAAFFLFRLQCGQPTPVFFARRIPCTEKPGGLQSTGLAKSSKSSTGLSDFRSLTVWGGLGLGEIVHAFMQ